MKKLSVLFTCLCLAMFTVGCTEGTGGAGDGATVAPQSDEDQRLNAMQAQEELGKKGGAPAGK